MKKHQNLTIIIPTLDRDIEFPGAITSAINSDSNASIVVSLNKSNELTLNNCKKIVNERVKFKYWDERLNIGDHWSKIVSSTIESEYFTLIPDDDRITNSKYYDQAINALKNNPDCVAAFADQRLSKIAKLIQHQKISQDFIKVQGNEFLKILRSDIKYVLDICPTHYTTILKTESAKKAGLYPNCHSPDLLLFTKICKFGDILVSVIDAGEYKWNENGLSKKPNIKMLTDELEEIEKLRFEFTENDGLINRLKTRTERAIFVAAIKCIFLQKYSESLNGFQTLGLKCVAINIFNLMIRISTGRWPKLDSCQK